MDLVDHALRCNRESPRFAYIAPYYVQSKDVAWMYVKKFCSQVPGAEFVEGELRVDFPHNGARIRLYGADNADRMRGLYFDGVILDEAADFDPRVWPEVLRPALADRGGWAVWIGTPKGRNAFWEVFERAKAEPDEWFSFVLRADDSGILDEAELEDARKEMTPEQYEQEFNCSFDAAIKGAYYGKEIADAEREGRITDVPYDPALPVHTAFDLGIGDSTAIWLWQVAPDGVRIIDHYENHGHGIAHYVAELNSRPYKYGIDFLPHDARARLLGTGRTLVETVIGMGRNARIVTDHKIMDGINAVRVSFPKFWFDRDKCKFGLEALRQYRADFDEKTKAYKDRPRHDWTSHTADAARYMAMAWRELKPEAPKIVQPSKLVFSAQSDGAIRSNMSINDIIRRMERQRKSKGR